MRTIIDLPENQINELQKLTQSKQVSRAEIIRRAVNDYIVHHRTDHSDQAFGILKLRHKQLTDGVDYQNDIRSEWE